tara:strand:+ start:28958 stop:29401 length:444 start_codon:yes stop_codon:yes gene_type:complete
MFIKFLAFDELSAIQLYDILRLRQQVFMIEQNCLYEDADNSDQEALHLLFYENTILVGYLRIFEPGIKFKETTLGRIVVSPEYRGKEIGAQVITKGIELAFQQFPDSDIKIEAQSALTSYYNKYGFKEEGEIYIVDDIKHIQMTLKG